MSEVSPYYPLFKFFSDAHNLILLDSEIEEIIEAVHEFDDKIECELIKIAETAIKSQYDKAKNILSGENEPQD